MNKSKNMLSIAIAALVLQSSPGYAQQAAATVSSATAAIRPFQVHFPEEALTDLRNRIQATNWPDAEVVSDASQGVPQATMKKLADYWAHTYDWRKAEARLNALPQFITTIDGVDIHFIHVRSKHKNALPVIITHGWPGSVIEQLKMIDPLTNPTAYGGKAEDAFDVIIPSIPGYGFSGKPTETGWDPARIAKAWITLMQRLGYRKFVAQGGDWGDAISEQMALLAPPELLGIHTNMAATVPPAIAKALKDGAARPSGLLPDEQRAYDQLDFFFKHGLGYATEMGTRPQTLYGINDSPIGLAAWILDHDAQSLALIRRVFDGQEEGLSKDDVLDNITLYWLTKTAVSSARLFWESKLAFFDAKNVRIPVAVSAFPDEIYTAPHSWAEQAFPKLIHYNKLTKGGHFAAWEQPELLVRELRSAFRPLR
ncbi:epoxide hydrolase family protein [Taibaiella chishuiensis]|uniref:Pimeloyl-ACP methyl ester carboxylesterase n=1 Tax=Taibaiella chishuiensis TaxID=1434707 RepID=A0A2P8D311_9BACT|nr:epoxide hydrolase [Taibaiella chishuiensis]PSK91612.1 pimeloyl-ACP methyl ester carboxylesterase [Taibaiella chishuiensis]